MKKVLCLLVTFVLFLSGCSNSNYEIYEFDYFYFDTSMNIKVYYTDKDNFDFETMDEEMDNILKDLEYTFSSSLPDSELGILNQEDSIEASDDFINVATKANYYCELTDGVYDPSSGKLIDLWSINNRNILPTDDEIQEVLKTINCENIVIEGNNVTIDDQLKVDYGSIAKGYASDVLHNYLLDQGVTSALINLGGNIDTVGTKPDGTEFKIAIMRPEIDNVTAENVLSIPVNDKVVITSGINQRYFTGDNGEIYHHILDANTGYQPDNNLASVTIIGDSGIDADALSTVSFLEGVEKGTEIINSIENTEAIFITRDHKIYMTNPDMEYELIDESYEVVTQ